jgi:hypothetical protein
MTFDMYGNIPKQTLTAAPEKYLKGQVSGFYEIGDHRQASVDVFYPYKYLPIRKLDYDLQDGLVLLKGTVVGAVCASNEASGYLPGSDNVFPIFQDSAGAIVTRPIDNTYFGYERGVKSAIVPCNGGLGATYTYRTMDTTRTFKSTTSLASAGDTCIIPANRPIGIVSMGVFQDFRGMHLNYGIQGYVGVLFKNEVQIPFVDIARFDPRGSYFGTVDSTGYVAARDDYVFLRLGTGFAPGSLVQADEYGKYIAANGNQTDQTVGRIISLDIRWPQGGLEYSRTFPDSEMPGDQTGGLLWDLYKFVKLVLTAVNGTTPTSSDIVDAIQAGYFGVANIEITI